MSMTKEQILQEVKRIDAYIAQGTYKDNWESLAYHKVPDWYKRSKFGIFIHWGAYSVPAFGNEWYPRNMYKKDLPEFSHHIKTYGEHKDFGYRDFIPMFKAEKFDAKEWVDLFYEAGAKFVMPVAEHHDGFQMYHSDISDWCTSKMGPKKDILGLLKNELEKKDMVLTASTHRIEHYWFMAGMREFESDMKKEPEYGDIYWPSVKEPFPEGETEQISGFEVDDFFMKDWLVRCCELVDNYKPKVIYFDWWIQVESMKPYLKKFAAYYYNKALEWGEEVAINFKNDAFMYQSGIRDIERGQLSDISPTYWQNDTSVAKNSWGYTVGNDYKQPHEIICDLVDVVSKNGSLLLNIGPMADGTIPNEDKHILKEVGKWLKVNGEGIYETTHWKKYGEGPTILEEGHFTDLNRGEYKEEDFRFTFKPNNLFVFSMHWPKSGEVKIHTLGKKNRKFNAIIKNVEILGADTCEYELLDECLKVSAKGIDQKAPVCIKLTID